MLFGLVDDREANSLEYILGGCHYGREREHIHWDTNQRVIRLDMGNMCVCGESCLWNDDNVYWGSNTQLGEQGWNIC